MKKKDSARWLPLVGIIAMMVVLAIIRFGVGGPEDAWICDRGEWVRHGNPSQAAPATGCGVGSAATGTYHRFKDDQFEIDYPDWRNIDNQEIRLPQDTKLAVADGGCTLVITAAPVPAGDGFKEFTEKQLFLQQAQSDKAFQVVDKEITDRTARVEGDISLGGTILKGMAYNFLTSKRSCYSVGFLAVKSRFADACEPLMRRIVDSAAVK